jgi:outer membrane protein OmpA-like peptidoglycan-associated protein
LELTDESGKIQNLGPYTEDRVSIPGKSILGTQLIGDYNVKMIGQLKSGNSVVKAASIHMVLWVAPKDNEGMRYSILYEFNKSEAINMYHKYLTNVVIPKIPIGGKVIIHGHTDVIGEEQYNQRLSLARANNVRTILENGLKKVGRSDVTFEVSGFGGNQKLSPFENRFPEERFYNRTVIIDIIPEQ